MCLPLCLQIAARFVRQQNVLVDALEVENKKLRHFYLLDYWLI